MYVWDKKVAKAPRWYPFKTTNWQLKKVRPALGIAEAKAVWRLPKKITNAIKPCLKKKSVSRKELENVTLNYQSIQAKYNAALNMQKRLPPQGIHSAQSPFDGVVTQVSANNGMFASPGMPLVVIEKPGTLEVIASVTESDIPYISEGMQAHITVKSMNKTFATTVREKSPRPPLPAVSI